MKTKQRKSIRKVDFVYRPLIKDVHSKGAGFLREVQTAEGILYPGLREPETDKLIHISSKACLAICSPN